MRTLIRTLWRILIAAPPPEPEPVDRSPRGPGERVMCLDCEATYDCRSRWCPACASRVAMPADLAGAR